MLYRGFQPNFLSFSPSNLALVALLYPEASIASGISNTTSLEEVFAIKKEIDLFSTALDLGDVLTKLKGVFENKFVTKITNSSKTDKKILKK